MRLLSKANGEQIPLWMTMAKDTGKAEHFTCDVQSFPSLLSVTFLNTNNLSGVVKATGRVFDLENVQNHIHNTYSRSTQ